MFLRKTWMVGVCVPLLSVGAVVPQVARAEPPARGAATKRPSEFQIYLQAALRMYESLDYEQALEKLTRAKSYVSDIEEDVLLSFHEGILLAHMHRQEQARSAFRAGLLLKPDAALPMKVAPKVEKEFEAVRAEVLRELEQVRAAEPPPPEDAPAVELSAPVAAEPPPPVVAERPAPALPAAGLTVAVNPRKGLSYALLGGGVVMAGAGAFLGVSGLSYNERKKELTSSEAVKARATAGTHLTAGTVLLGAGLAALGTGTVLFLRSRDESGSAAAGPAASLLLSPLPGGFALGSTGRF